MSKILRTIAIIRLKQLFRQLKEIGWLYLLLLAPLLFIFLLRVLEFIQKDSGPEIGIVVLLLLLFTHLQRQDVGLLQQIDCSPKWVFITEYFFGLLGLSLLIFFVVGNSLNPLIIQVGAILIALIPRRHRISQRRIRLFKMEWLSLTAFEWRVGLRRYLILWLPGYMLCLLLAHYIAVIPLFLLIFAFGAASFYDPIEGKELLEVIHFKTKVLHQKLKIQCIIFHSLMLPLYLLFLFWHLEYWYIIVAILIPVQLLLWMSIFYKYANYHPNRVSVQNQMIIGIFGLCLFNPMFPILFPGIILYLYRYWKKANYNLLLFYAEN